MNAKKETILRRKARWRRFFGKPPNIYSASLVSCFNAAKEVASNAGQECEPFHMLVALSRSNAGIAVAVLKELNFPAPQVPGPRPAAGELAISMEFKAMLALGAREALAMKDYYVGTHHVLLGLLGRKTRASDELNLHGINHDSVLGALAKLAKSGRLID